MSEMKNWFLATVKCEKMLPSGAIKKVSEMYLVNAVSCTDAESKVVNSLANIYDNFEVVSVKKSVYKEIIFDNEGESWYSSKINLITLDEKTGMDKKTSVPILVQAVNLESSVGLIKKSMKDSISDYDIYSVAFTPIVDVIN